MISDYGSPDGPNDFDVIISNLTNSKGKVLPPCLLMTADCVFVYSRKRRVLVQQLEQTRHRVTSSKSPLEKEFDIGVRS